MSHLSLKNKKKKKKKKANMRTKLNKQKLKKIMMGTMPVNLKQGLC